MLKYDKDVNEVMKKMDRAGAEVYAVGECVIQWACGMTPVEWDLVTRAALPELQELFPEGTVVDENEGIYRLDFTREEENKDGEVDLAGSICDITPVKGTIEEELSGYGFTILAVGDNPGKPLLDPYGGMDDIRKKLVRTIRPARELFSDEPIRMMQAIRYVSEYGFDLHKDIYDAIVSCWRLLLDHPKEPIRRELEMILVGSNTGKALNMMADTGLMAAVFGEEVSRKMSSGEMQRFLEVCKNIDKLKPLRMRRLGIFYTVLDKKRGLEAIERMEWDEDTDEYLRSAQTDLLDVAFLNSALDLKKYIFENGWKKYNRLHNLTKAQRIIYDQSSIKIEARNEYMRQIRANNEPIFTDELVIDANDILEAGITDDPERAEELLKLIIAKVHMNPVNNHREVLLKLAKKYNKSKFSVATRYVKWMR